MNDAAHRADARAGAGQRAVLVDSLFFLSGVARLVNQASWSRPVGLAVGQTAEAAAIVLAVYFTWRAVASSLADASLLVTRGCLVRKTLWHASAGPEPRVLLTDAPTALLLPATGTLLGVVPDGTWVTEAMDAGGSLFGSDRVSEAILGGGRASPERVVRAVDQAVLRHLAGPQPADDYTLAAVRFGCNLSEHETQE